MQDGTLPPQSLNNQYHHKEEREWASKNKGKEKAKKKPRQSDRGVCVCGKSLIVVLFSSEIDHFLFLYWPFVFLHLAICLLRSLATFFLGICADVSIIGLLPGLRSPILPCMGCSYCAGSLALLLIPKFLPWLSTWCPGPFRFGLLLHSCQDPFLSDYPITCQPEMDSAQRS